MIYLQDPIHLPYMVPMKFRMGRTTLTLQVPLYSYICDSLNLLAIVQMYVCMHVRVE